MPKFEVCIVESRDLIFEVEAENAEEAAELANEMEANDAVRDSFRERTLDWAQPV
jgi:hypothetical protein